MVPRYDSLYMTHRLNIFEGFDWEALRKESVQAPMIPEIKNPFDVSNFEQIGDEDEAGVPEETSGWDSKF